VLGPVVPAACPIRRCAAVNRGHLRPHRHPTLFDLLPGYLPMPHVHGNEDLASYVHAESMDKGFWANLGTYLVRDLRGGPGLGPGSEVHDRPSRRRLEEYAAPSPHPEHDPRLARD
jgi:hypothetical protein